MALPEDKVLEEEDDFLDVAGDVLAAPFRGVEGAIQGAYNLADYLAFDVLPDYDTRFLGTSKTMAGGAVEGIAQFATGFVPLFGLAGRVGTLAKAGTVTKGVVAGAATDFTFFNGQEARLSNLIQQVPELQNPVTEFLAYDKDEGELEGRMKNVLEGLGLEAVAGVFIKSLKAMKKARKAKEEGVTAEQQAQLINDELGGGAAFADLPSFTVDGFRRSVTSVELDEFRTQQKIPEIKLRKTGAHPTQIATTKATYEKVKPQLKEGSTIDFGAGKNIAVKAGIKADSFEPFPEKGFEPTFKDSSKIPSNSYDNVINNAVLNVVPQDIRDDLVSEIGRILKVGGKAFINVRGKDVFDSKHTVISKENMEVIVDSTGAYQKGFSKEELVGYLGEVLGDGFDVKVSTKFGTVAAEVAKKSDVSVDLPEFREKQAEPELQQKLDELGETVTDIDEAIDRRPGPFKTYEEEAMMDIIPKGAGNLKSRLMKKFPIKGADPEDVADVEKFIDVMGQRMFGDVSLSVTNKIPSAGRYNFGNNLLQIRQATIDKGEIKRTMVHELWHSLSRYLPSTDVDSLTKQFQKERQNYLDDLGKRAKDKAKTPSERIALAKELNGFKKGEFTSDNYRYADVDEYFAEEMTDAFLKKLDEKDLAPTGTLKRIAQEVAIMFKDMFASLKAKLGIDQRQKIFNDFLKQRNVTKRAEAPLDFRGRSFAEMPDFKKGADEVLQAIPEKFRGYAEALMDPAKPTPKLPRFALETSDDVIELKDLLESYYKENPDKITVEGAVLELDAEIEKSLMLQEGKDAATKIAEARIVQQSIRDQGVAVVNNLSEAVQKFKDAGGGDVAIADIKNNFQQLLSIADVYRNLGRQGSLLLGSRREGFVSRKIGLNEADFKIDGLRKQFANDSGMDPQKMVDLIDEHIDPTDPVGSLERLFKTAKKAQGKSMLDMPIEYWMNAILSGPKTQVVNAMGNSITQVMTSIEAVLGGVASGNMDVVKAVFAAWADGKMYSEAARFAKKAFKQSDNVLDPNSRAFSDRPNVAISGQRVSEAIPGQGLTQRTENGIDWFANNIIRIPSRLLMTTDEFFKQLAYRRAARLKAAMSGLQQGIRDPQALAEHINKTLEGVITEGGRMGSEEGLAREAYDIFKSKSEFKPAIDELDALENKKRRSDLSEADTKRLRALKQKVGKDRNKFVGDYVQNNFDDTKSSLIQYAQDEARYLTFTKELEPGLGKGLQNITNNIPAARLILPFVRTPTNILTFALERTPLNIPLTKESWDRFKLELGNPDPIVKAQARGKLVTAALVGYTLMDAVQNGNGAITGGGPSDERQKKALQAAGWQPYSIKIGDEYYSYQRLDPIATPLGIIADIVETGVTESKDFDESELEHATQAFLLALTRNVTNKSYLAGIQTFTDALSDPDRFVPRFGRNFVSSFVPNLISQMADSDTQVMKESRSVMDAVKKKLGDRNGLDSKRNVLGEEIMMETMLDSPLQFLNPIAFSTKKDDPVLQEMAGLNHAFRVPPPSLGGQIDMLAYKNEAGQSAYDRWQELLKSTKIGGQSLRQSLTRLVKSRDYKKLSPESEPGLESPRITQINNLLTKYRKEARKRMLREFPELSKQYSALTLAKTRFKTGVSREDVLALLSQ